MVAVAPTGSSPAPADGVSADEAGEAPAPASNPIPTPAQTVDFQDGAQ